MMDPLLQIIPTNRLSPEQKAFRPAKDQAALPVYQMLFDPTHLNEFRWKQYNDLAIWRENGTLMCISKETFAQYEQRNVCFTLHGDDVTLKGAIYGATDAAIAETFTFFFSLKDPEETKPRFAIGSYSSSNKDYHFDFGALQPEQLAQVLDANPTRRFKLHAGVWNTEQSVVLATRPYPMDLSMNDRSVVWMGWLPLGDFVPGRSGDFTFSDHGTAFVDALEKRQSSFGSLSIERHTRGMPVSNENLRRLCHIQIFEALTLDDSLPKEFLFLPFSANLDVLQCTLEARRVEPEDFDTLDIVTKDLDLQIHVRDGDEDWGKLLLSFFNRLAKLGHMERLKFSLNWRTDLLDHTEGAEPITKALIAAINANSKLKELDLRDALVFDATSHLNAIFRAMEDHKSLRSFTLGIIPTDETTEYDDDIMRPPPFDYSTLERLLARNRNITVFNHHGEKITNGSSIDKIYALNRFFHGSTKLTKESTALKPLLVTTGLLESASKDFQRAGLLLANHTDVLCELVQGENLE